MRIIQINWSPTNRQLRQFAVICAVVLPLVTWRWAGTGNLLWGMTAAGLVTAIGGLLFPRLLKWPFVALSVITTPLGLIIGEVTMLVVYFGLFLPIGLAFRMMGRDRLQRKIDRSAASYWERKKQPSSVRSYFRQS